MKKIHLISMFLLIVALIITTGFLSCKKETSTVPGYIEYTQAITPFYDTIVIPAYSSRKALKAVVISTIDNWTDSAYLLSAQIDTNNYAITISRSERLESTVFDRGFDSAYKEKTYRYNLTEDYQTFTTRFLDNEQMIFDSITTNLERFQSRPVKFVFSGSVNFGTRLQIFSGQFGVNYYPNIIVQSEFVRLRYYY